MGLASFFAPVETMVLCALVFVCVDFLTGVLADRKKVKIVGGNWTFESKKAWRTVTKLSFVMAGIVLAWLIDALLLPFMELRLANIFTGFAGGEPACTNELSALPPASRIHLAGSAQPVQRVTWLTLHVQPVPKCSRNASAWASTCSRVKPAPDA